MGMSAGVGSVGGTEFGVGTSSGGGVVVVWRNIGDIMRAALAITV
jgi:hypothetical protein